MGFVQEVRKEEFRVLTNLMMHEKCSIINKVCLVQKWEKYLVSKDMELEGTYKHKDVKGIIK